MIKFDIQNTNGQLQSVELPGDINLNLMEVLKASDYPIVATCGGMALCATCYVEVIQGEENLPAPNDIELDMIDTLPYATSQSRLACQIKLDERLNGAIIRLRCEPQAKSPNAMSVP